MSARTRAKARTRLAVQGIGLVAALLCGAAQADECVRGTPTAMYHASRKDIGAHRFDVTSGHEAVERFRLGPRMQVQVDFGGCEYIMTKMRFTSPGLFAGGASGAAAYRTAAALLGQLRQTRPAFDFDLVRASRTLLQLAGRREVPEFGQPFPIDGDGPDQLPAFIQIDGAGRSASLGYLDVTLFRGPL